MTSKQVNYILSKYGKDLELRKKEKKKAKLAKLTDRHKLYEASVQDTDAEFEFVDTQFRRIRGRRPGSMREDFCGTANMSCAWVTKRNQNTAIGVDMDADVLDWGRENHVSKLTASQQKRLTLIQGDVLKVKTPPIDVVLAMNFSYSAFKERKLMRRYFKSVYNSLNEQGVFFVDVFGGYEAFRELEEKTKHKGFNYIWDQHSYNPITGDMMCYIHFSFPDGSRMRNAFAYEWRMWTLPELQEILGEAGFKNVTVYWQGTDEESGEGNGEFQPATVGDADAGWIAFISAEK